MWSLVGVASLALVAQASAYTITQVHIAFGLNASTTMSVAWVSQSNDTMTVSYSTDKQNLNMVSAESTFTRYSIDHNYWGPSFGYNNFSNYTSDWIHNTTLRDLEPFTTYFYQVAGISQIFNFTTALPPGHFRSDNQPQFFSIVGDLGQTSDSRLTMRHMMGEGNKADAAIIIGDISYADCYQPRWDSSGIMLEPLAANHPLMVLPGNHEIEWFANDKPTFVAYETRYFMPAVAPAQGQANHISWRANNDDMNDDDVPASDRWCTPSSLRGRYEYGNAFYSFTVGLVHFVSLNCYGPTDEGSIQYDWLEQDFKSIDRDVVPWLVVLTHCPWYNTNNHHYNEWQTVEMKANMEELFQQYEVNLVLTGHVHAYERSYPVYKDQRQSNAPVYVVVGDGGNREGHAWGYQNHSRGVEWVAFNNDTEFGHGSLTVFNHSSMLWEWHINDDPNWIVHDQAYLVRYAATADDDTSSHHHKYKNPLPAWARTILMIFVAIVTVAVIGGACYWERLILSRGGPALLKSEDLMTPSGF